jgi:hypothetical protein
MNYLEDSNVDEEALDVEWLRQTRLAMKYARNVSHKKKLMRLASEKVKTIRSDLINEANVNPKDTTNKLKPNAQDIEAYYRRHPAYIEAKDHSIKAQYDADYADLAFGEISYTRKAALEHLVKLHGQMYFAGPTVPRDLSYELVQKSRQARVDSKVNLKQKEGD